MLMRGPNRFRPMPARPALGTALADLRTSVEASANLTDPVQSLGAARDALAKSQAFGAALTTAYAQASKQDDHAAAASAQDRDRCDDQLRLRQRLRRQLR